MSGLFSSATTAASAVVSFLYWPLLTGFCLLWVCVVADHLLAGRERRERLEWKQFMRGAVR